jgi:hypothetical protein
MTVPDRTLRQYLAGALEPPDQEEVERELSASTVLRERLAVLLATSASAPEPGPSWVLPPPQVHGPLRAAAEPVATMDATSDIGWLVVRLEVPTERRNHRIVVLERRSSEWEVLYPGPDDPPLRASDLPVEGDRTRLDLSTEGRDPRRMAVVLVDREPAASGDRWEEVREALAAGEAVAVTFDVRGGAQGGAG